MQLRSIIIGILGALALFATYVGSMSLDGGVDAALRGLSREPWIIAGIVIAFGVQVALYRQIRFNLINLKRSQNHQGHVRVGAVTTTASAGSMLACCLHHVTDVLPFLGATAVSAFLGQYRSWLFGLAYLSSAIGIIIMIKSLKHTRSISLYQPSPVIQTHTYGYR